MLMRIPGISPQEASMIAQAVGRSLAQRAWRWPQGGRIGDLDLRLTLAGERSRDALVAQIVEAMTAAIDAKITQKASPSTH